ncbi:ATP-dependent helicase HrpB [Treponema sp. Marseille-Q4523]|uniref:ATP-dependent helicase HrpB n=1 Tax=Treponema sp. Marseille-Q4523 TaxID=2810610 RepID=UPI00196034CE|nr:ATP-dependent helicase HrpB [Treponema sp. Marseille-Q4523]MBM7023269.1 ATP-dependent helicase HrpB [Treponema sp. Marseille-Q4523]
MYPDLVKQLPIAPYLDDICVSLKSSPSHSLILTAETGAGKSTALPLALLNHFSGKIVMLEPRRIAALSVASRVSTLLGEEVGKTAGYVMRLESRVSKAARFTVMTEAVLTRMLQDDLLLDGVSVVVLDEFHERSVQADLALAFLKETMPLRDDLYVVVMSATIDTASLSSYLAAGGETSPVFAVPGRQFPVDVEYAGVVLPSDAVMRELRRRDRGSILVFLPGIADIRKTAAELERESADADILILHSSIDFDEQKKVLSPPDDFSRRRVILSSSIAETSLSVPGVSVVIDSGLARINRMNASAGMEMLVTEIESVFSAEQRKGRAGRMRRGRCVRLWRENEVRAAETAPEIARTDLTELVLECAERGVYRRDALSWLTPPSAGAWKSAQKLLITLGCLREENRADAENSVRITSRGKAALTLGLHPRLACVALSALRVENAGESTEKENGLSKKERGGLSSCAESALQCVLAYSPYADSPSALQKRFSSDLIKRLAKCASRFPDLCGNSGATVDCVRAAAVLLLAGFPDRIARLEGDGTYRFPSGRVASLPKKERDAFRVFPEWIVAPVVDAGEKEGRIYRWEALSAEEAEAWLSGRSETYTETEFTEGTHSLRKTEYTCFGKIVLSERRIAAQDEDFACAVCRAVEKNGIVRLPLGERAKAFLERARFYEAHTRAFRTAEGGDAASADGMHTIAKSSEENLIKTVREWLPPFLTGTVLRENAVYDALYYYLDGAKVDKNVPRTIALPNGKSCTLLYVAAADGTVRPTIEIIVQRIFGCFETPCVMGVPVLFKLLSPARRPLQITDDLAGFWSGAWPEICKEMKGRYPKHNWDYRAAERE